MEFWMKVGPGLGIIIVICTIFILDRVSTLMVYSWKTLIFTLLAGGWIFISSLTKILSGELSPENMTEFLKMIIGLILLGYLIFRGLWVSFTGDGLVEENLERILHKRACQNLFGPWALIAPWGGIVLIVLAALSVERIPSPTWVSILLLIGGLAYHIRVHILVRKHIKMEKDKGVVY